MLLRLIFIELSCILFAIATAKIDKSSLILAVTIVLILSVSVFKTVSYGQLLWSPQIKLSNSVTNTTDGMLACLSDHYPLIDTWGLQNCVSSVQVYNVSKGRVPYLSTVPVAFVIKMVFDKHVFVVDEYYSPQNDINQALILIHECSHLVLSTIDYAYRWQPEFKLLKDTQHEKNADSYIDLIINNCLTDIDVVF